jgi:hypothetical protein
MKKIFAILFLMALTSCGSSLQPPMSNSDFKNIVGKSVKIGNIEVAQYDFPNWMKWDDANEACEALGNGWRLPTKEELNILYQNRVVIGGFTNSLYWSSTEIDYLNAWSQGFVYGIQLTNSNTNPVYVRAVRTF